MSNYYKVKKETKLAAIQLAREINNTGMFIGTRYPIGFNNKLNNTEFNILVNLALRILKLQIRNNKGNYVPINKATNLNIINNGEFKGQLKLKRKQLAGITNMSRPTLLPASRTPNTPRRYPGSN